MSSGQCGVTNIRTQRLSRPITVQNYASCYTAARHDEKETAAAVQHGISQCHARDYYNTLSVRALCSSNYLLSKE